MANKLLFKIHGWLGLNLGLILFIICFSGTFAVLSNEFDWLVNPDMRIQQKDSQPNWQKMTTSLEQKFPSGVNLGMYRGTYSGNGSYFATVAYIYMPTDQTLKVYLNPATGEIKSYTSFFNTQRFFRTFHRRFFDGNRGIFIITLMSIPLLVIVVLGFLFYKGWLKNLFTLRINRKKRIRWSDTHKIAGIWSLLIALLLSLTGLFYFYELLMLNAGKNDIMVMPQPEQVSETNLAGYGKTIKLKSVDTYVDSALSAYPGLHVQGIRLPKKAGDFVYINGQEGNPITRDRANHVLLDPATAEVVDVLKSSEMTLLPFITDIADPLHFGYFGGLSTKIIWFIFGLVISLSILSGTYIWVIKTVEKSRKRKQKSGFPWLRGVTVSIIITLVYLMWVTYATVDGIRNYGPMPDPVSQKITAANISVWNTELLTTHYFNEPGNRYLELKFRSEGLPNIKKVTLNSSQHNIAAQSHRFDTYGTTYYLDINNSVRKQLQMADETVIIVEGYDGQIYNYPILSQSVLTSLEQLNKRIENYSNNVKRSWPQHNTAIWIYIGGFLVLSIIVVIIWCRWILQAIRLRVGNTAVREPYVSKKSTISA